MISGHAPGDERGEQAAPPGGKMAFRYTEREFQETATTMMQALLAASALGKFGTYRCLLDGDEVIVGSFIEPQENGLFQAKPLILLLDDHLFDRLQPLGSTVAVTLTPEELAEQYAKRLRGEPL